MTTTPNDPAMTEPVTLAALIRGMKDSNSYDDTWSAVFRAECDGWNRACETIACRIEDGERRAAPPALGVPADMVAVPRELLTWLVSFCGDVLDEIGLPANSSVNRAIANQVHVAMKRVNEALAAALSPTPSEVDHER